MSITHTMNYTHTQTRAHTHAHTHIHAELPLQVSRFHRVWGKGLFLYGNLVISHYYIKHEIGVRVTYVSAVSLFYVMLEDKNSPFFSFR